MRIIICLLLTFFASVSLAGKCLSLAEFETQCHFDEPSEISDTFQSTVINNKKYELYLVESSIQHSKSGEYDIPYLVVPANSFQEAYQYLIDHKSDLLEGAHEAIKTPDGFFCVYRGSGDQYHPHPYELYAS